MKFNMVFYMSLMFVFFACQNTTVDSSNSNAKQSKAVNIQAENIKTKVGEDEKFGFPQQFRNVFLT